MRHHLQAHSLAHAQLALLYSLVSPRDGTAHSEAALLYQPSVIILTFTHMATAQSDPGSPSIDFQVFLGYPELENETNQDGSRETRDGVSKLN